ncbi:G-protein coupled receptor 182-like [Protopterus annectens]|uniref:G-protein coupled receptor 182-like n=1 Tax=Protopterus annectens TaxID=7888 RepID=UPI001CFB3A81|nr:G-protein coupled receptor 182-like [Protopterus annectens]
MEPENSTLASGLNTQWVECTVSLDEKARKVVVFLLYLFIFVVGLIENLIVVWVNWRKRHAKESVSFYILNMAIADLVLILTVPFWIMDVVLEHVWLWGRFLCKFIYFIYLVDMFSSVFFLTCMTIERYRLMVLPTQASSTNQERNRKIICGCIWVLAIVLSVPENIHVDLMVWEDAGCFYMPPLDTYETWVVVTTFLTVFAGFFIPFPIILILNILIARAIKSNSNLKSQKSYKILYAYVIAFIVCWLPRHMIIFLIGVDEVLWSHSCNVAIVLYYLYSIVECISLLHCVLNPILYNFLSKGFRNNLLRSVVRFVPKEHLTNKKAKESSTSSTRHSVVIT